MSPKVSPLTPSSSISRILILVVLVVLSSILLPRSVVNAQTGAIRVTQTGSTSGSCGTSWASPCDLQYALSTVAVSGTEIWVAAGLYKPTTVSTNVTATFALTTGVALYGGFAGTEDARDQRDWTNNVTVLSGDIDTNDLTDSHGIVTTTANIIGTNAFHVVTGNNTDLTAILDGFTISGGNANGSDPNDKGGGLYSDSGTPTLRNVTFSGNAAILYGGGLFNVLSNSTITNAVFTGNSAHFGGGLYNYFSNPLLVSITFSDNLASPNTGGGLYNLYSSPTLTNVTFSRNSAAFAGGGMANNRSSPLVTQVIFSGNSALLAGGMFNVNDGSNPVLMNVTFDGNFASYDGGGGMYNLAASPILTNVTFISNTTTGSGGGMATETGNPSLTNVTFSGNAAGSGGGINNASSSNPMIRNIILWGNTATTGSQLNNDGTSNPTITDSVVQGGYSSGSNIITADPQLGPFADYGGGTPTIPLLPNSAAIDAGSVASCPAQDQRGQARDDIRCDIGAYELKYADSHTVSLPVSGASVTTFGPMLMGIQRDVSFTDPGIISVTRSGWKTQGVESIGATWSITPTTTTGFSLTLQLCYTPAELGTLSESALNFWRYSGGTWLQASGTPSLSIINGYHCATLSGITALSTWTLAVSGPTAVTLKDLSASSQPAGFVPLLVPIVAFICVSGTLLAKRRRQV